MQRSKASNSQRFSRAETRQLDDRLAEAARYARSASVPPQDFQRDSFAYRPAQRERFHKSGYSHRLRVSRSTFNKIVVRRTLADGSARVQPFGHVSDHDLVKHAKRFDVMRKKSSHGKPDSGAKGNSSSFFDKDSVASKDKSFDMDAFLQSIAGKSVPCDDVANGSGPSYTKKSFFDNLVMTYFEKSRSTDKATSVSQVLNEA